MSPTGDLLVTFFGMGRCLFELAQEHSRVALAWHTAGRSAPFGVTNYNSSQETLQMGSIPLFAPFVISFMHR